MPISDKCRDFFDGSGSRTGSRMHIFRIRNIVYSEIQKGVIPLSATGYIQVHAYTSKAQIPLADVAITVTTPDNIALAMRLTNESGLIEPVEIAVPDLSESQTPDPPEVPFAVVNLYARLNDFEQVEIEDLQVFANTVTDQDLEMIPLSELPETWNRTTIFQTPAQNL